MVESEPDVSKQATTNRLAINVEGVDLPDDSEKREALLERIENEVDRIVDDEGLSGNSAAAKAGHQYTQAPGNCPRCDHPLEAQRSHTIDGEMPSKTSLTAICPQCGYSGGAVYSLVDIETNKYIPERQAEMYRSEVQDRNVYPSYISYE
jgi:hypothetical protein